MGTQQWLSSCSHAIIFPDIILWKQSKQSQHKEYYLCLLRDTALYLMTQCAVSCCVIYHLEAINSVNTRIFGRNTNLWQNLVEYWRILTSRNVASLGPCVSDSLWYNSHLNICSYVFLTQAICIWNSPQKQIQINSFVSLIDPHVSWEFCGKRIKGWEKFVSTRHWHDQILSSYTDISSFTAPW